MLRYYQIDIAFPHGDETETKILVWSVEDEDMETSKSPLDCTPIIEAPASQVEAFAHRLLQAVTRAKRHRHPSVQRG